MISSITKSCREVLEKRTASPLFGAFIISWLAWNYKMVFTILSKGNYAEQLAYIDNKLYTDSAALLNHYFWFPLGTALFFIFIYPYPAKWVFNFTRRRQVELINSQNHIDGSRLLTREESHTLIQTLANNESAHRESFEKRQREIDELRNELKAVLNAKSNTTQDNSKELQQYTEMILQRDTKIKELESHINDLSKNKHKKNSVINLSNLPYLADLNEDEIQILSLFASFEESEVNILELRNGIQMNKLKFNHYIKKLAEAGYVELSMDSETARITEEGSSYLIQNNLI